MTTRREFLKEAVLAGGGLVFGVPLARGGRSTTSFFGVHEFVGNHPDAVFVFRTSVDAKTNTAAIKNAAYALGKTLFVPRTSPENAFPVTAPVVLKPNVTAWAWDKAPVEETMGIQTDPWFVEGLINALRDLAVPASGIFVREANYNGTAADATWYKNLAARTGVDLKVCKSISQIAPADVQWTDVQSGVWYKRIPFLWPVNAPGSCLINIAKFKSHSMGITLCSKNLQGTNVSPYVAHCKAWNTASTMPGVSSADVVPNASANILANYERHRDAGIPRWRTLNGDSGNASAGGLWMETHTARCIDNNSVLRPALNMIEGVYGREGPFVSGPATGDYGIDIMANIVVFGMNAQHVDIIGTYLAGHEPGNFGLFHLARERGLSKFLNPRDITVYEWKIDGSATQTPLENFPRIRIRTLYLRQAGEEKYHMVDQLYDYTTTSAGRMERPPTQPDAFVLLQNFPNPFNPTTSIQYCIPSDGHVRLDVVDIRGEIVDVLVDGTMTRGDHLAVWNAVGKATGTYFARFRFDGMTRTLVMALLR